MINNYFLYNDLPTLDLHGQDRYSAVILTNEFVSDNLKLGNKLIIVVHGKGKEILKTEIHKSLKTNKNVKVFKTDMFNPGATIIELK